MINLKGRYFNLEIEYKNIKHLYLRIKDLNTIYITCSKRINYNEIIRFIYLKEDWILNKVNEFENNQRTSYLKIDCSIYYLGQQYNLLLKNGSPKFTINDSDLIIYSKKGTVEDGLNVFYNQSEKYLNKIVEECEPKYLAILNDYGYLQRPNYFYKKLKGRWGYCEVKNNKIVLNKRLIHFPSECIEAVLWHELLHFIVPNHSKRFHDILKLHMPSYQNIIDKMH